MSLAAHESFALFCQQLVNGVVQGSLYALVATGYNLIYGAVRLANFTLGEISLLGALLTVSLLHGFFGIGLPLAPAVLAAVAVCALLGGLLEIVFFRPLRRSSTLVGLLTSIALAVVLQNLASSFWGGGSRLFAAASVPAFFARPALQVGNFLVSWLQVVIVIIAVAVAAGLHLAVRHSRFGRALRAVSQDRTAALLVGVNVDLLMTLVFALASALSGIAGILAGFYGNSVFPALGWTLAVKGFVAAVLGGLGSLPGAFWGGLLLGLVEVFAAGYIASPYHEAPAFVLLIMILLLRPGAIAGWRSGPDKEII